MFLANEIYSHRNLKDADFSLGGTLIEKIIRILNSSSK